MPLLPPIETESELSYAYLHAVSAQAGMACEPTGRHADNQGIDAIIRATDTFAPDSILTDLAVDVQLKATMAEPGEINGRIPFVLHGIERYDKLRRATVLPPRILVVLFLPRDREEWLTWSIEELIIRTCAWWVSLRGAPRSTNTHAVTVYRPTRQHFNPLTLRDMMTRLSREEELLYDG